MEISIQNWILCGYDELTQLKMFSIAGFKHLDWNFCNYSSKTTFETDSFEQTEEFYKNFKKILDEKGMDVCQTHNIFPTYMDETNKEKMLFLLKKGIMATNILGAKYTVVHPMMPRHWEGEENRELRTKENVKFYNTLCEYAEKYNVIICIENMFGKQTSYGIYNETACSRYEEMVEIFNRLDNKDRFAFCFDSGHANMLYKEKSNLMIEALGKDIKVIHLHDNNGKIDFHRPPTKGNTNWDMIFSSLKNVGFNGIYDFELSPLFFVGLNKQSKLNKLYKSLISFISQYE